jgi:hypothetical protein
MVMVSREPTFEKHDLPQSTRSDSDSDEDDLLREVQSKEEPFLKNYLSFTATDTQQTRDTHTIAVNLRRNNWTYYLLQFSSQF